jgi:hypothetical protein
MRTRVSRCVFVSFAVAILFGSSEAQDVPTYTADEIAERTAGTDANWVPTRAGGRFEVLFRLYGPEKPVFDKTWKLRDIEKAD